MDLFKVAVTKHCAHLTVVPLKGLDPEINPDLPPKNYTIPHPVKIVSNGLRA